ncbi:SCO family protein [uncultured Aquimarina sp.]|uniref:SCO family protein n=1 Tax=uncultured Aquimarina sp. TaxID=575652 RepID=UPI0026375E8D|nr:SCO family protein [uncultured Aquimarina sp.]
MNARILKIVIIVNVVALVVLSVILYESFIDMKDTSLSSNSKKGLQIRQEFTKNEIPNFEFTNQYGQIITQNDFDNKIYVADFFFTSCPTICPIMAQNKIKIQNVFKNNSNVMILSHSIDVRSDSISRLRQYADQIGAIKNKWHLVTGERDKIFGIAEDYYVTAKKSNIQEGSYVHDGSFILIDENKRIQGIYDGTDITHTENLIADIQYLLEL